MHVNSVQKFMLRCFVLMLALTSLYLAQANTPSVNAKPVSATLLVAPSGSDTGGCGSAALPCRTIQYAVNLAGNGDFVLVAAGNYTFNAATDICSGSLFSTAVVCVVNKQLNILGGYSTSNWSAPDPIANPTIIDGGNSVRGVWVVSTGPATGLRIEGFTIRNGVGRAISARPGQDSIFGYGGGMFVEQAFVILRSLIFESNQAVGSDTGANYGGTGAGGGLAIRNSSGGTILENLVFQNNQARGGTGPERGGYGIGGGMFIINSNISSARALTFSNNGAMGGSTGGSGVDSILGQLADGLGGGMAIHDRTNVYFQRITATGNTAQGGDAPNGNAGGAFGGGIYAEGATVIIEDSNVSSNAARGANGINNDTLIRGTGLAQGGGIHSFNANMTINRVYIINNTARGGNGATYKGSAGGGGVALVRLRGGSGSLIVNTIIADNLAAMGGGSSNVAGGGGGGLWLQGTNTGIYHATIARNRLGESIMQGQGIVMLSFGADTATNVGLSYSIIAEHTSTSAAAIHVQPNNTINLNRGLWAGNNKDTNADWNPAGAFNGLGSMLSASSADFVSPGMPNEDYHLASSSPARDQAIGSTTTVDIDNQLRSNPDIGADEWTPPLNNQLHLPLIRQ